MRRVTRKGGHRGEGGGLVGGRRFTCFCPGRLIPVSVWRVDTARRQQSPSLRLKTKGSVNPRSIQHMERARESRRRLPRQQSPLPRYLSPTVAFDFYFQSSTPFPLCKPLTIRIHVRLLTACLNYVRVIFFPLAHTRQSHRPHVLLLIRSRCNSLKRQQMRITFDPVFVSPSFRRKEGVRGGLLMNALLFF